jgi:hypothetical protein
MCYHPHQFMRFLFFWPVAAVIVAALVGLWLKHGR